MGGYIKETLGLGLGFAKNLIEVINVDPSLTVRKGDVGLLHGLFPATTPGVSNFKVSDPEGGYQAIRFAPAGVPASIDGAATAVVPREDILPGQRGWAWLWHPSLKVQVSGATTVGQPLVLNQTANWRELRAVAEPQAKCVAIALEALGATGLCLVNFYGTVGFGKGAPA